MRKDFLAWVDDKQRRRPTVVTDDRDGLPLPQTGTGDAPTVLLPAVGNANIEFADSGALTTAVRQIDLRPFGEVYSSKWRSADWRNAVLLGLAKGYEAVKRHSDMTGDPVFCRPFAGNPLEIHVVLRSGATDPQEVSVIYTDDSPVALASVVERWLSIIGAASVQRYTNERLGAEKLTAIFYHFDA